MKNLILSSIYIFVLMAFSPRIMAAQSEPGAGESAKTSESKSVLKKWILFPIVYYTPESGVAAGGIAIQNLWLEKLGKTSAINYVGSYSQNKQSMVSIQPRFYFDQGAYEVYGSVFSGLSPNKFYNTLLTVEKYTEQVNNFNIGIKRQFLWDFFIKAQIGKDNRKITDWLISDEINSLILKGFGDIKATNYELGLEWDTRDFPQSAHEGQFHSISVNQYSIENLTDYKKIEGNLRFYFPIESSTLAVELTAGEIQGDNIPFQYQYKIGNSSKLRGYYAGKFRDNSLVSAQVEYRHQLNDSWSAVMFLSQASLAKNLAEQRNANAKSIAGLGGRYFLDPVSKTVLRADFGVSITGTSDSGFYFLMGEAF